MRFYEGVVYDVRLAVWPTATGVDYHILDRKSKKKAFLKCGLDREIRVGDQAVLVLYKGKKQKVIKLPFVKENERLVCDLPAFLEQNGVRYKIYKKPGTNCGGKYWDSISYREIACKNGELQWGSDWCVDWRNYWIGIRYNNSFPIIGGKKVAGLRFLMESYHAESEETLEWFKKSMEEQVVLTWHELGQVLDKLGLSKDTSFFDIQFCDDSIIEGNKINWEN